MTASLVRPRRLVAGDTVGVVATSAPLDRAQLARGVARLESWGLRVRVGPHALDVDPAFPFVAGRDADRAADLQSAWCDPAVAAVLVARGGSGAARIVDLLDWDAMKAAGPKLLVGFSDVTVLTQAVAVRLGLASLFGAMPGTESFAGEAPSEETVEHLRRTLFDPESVRLFSGSTTHRAGSARGVLVGGTVSLLACAVGTPGALSADGAIAILEGVSMSAPRLDNAITQLVRSGWFQGVRGIALGSWEDCDPAAASLVAARLDALGVPMVGGLGFGHCVPHLSIPIGVEAELDADARTLTLVEAALS